MKYFIDTEFFEKPGSIQLISIGIVCADGRKYYAVSKDFNLKEVWKDDWLRENVLRPIHSELCKRVDTYGKTYHWRLFEPFTRKSMRNLIKWYGLTNKQIADGVEAFVKGRQFCDGRLMGEQDWDWVSKVGKRKEIEDIEFYGYYADYDWVVFCWLFGRMIDLPKNFPMYCKDLKQMMDDKGLDKEWKRLHCPDPEGEHNALIDAKWNLDLYKQIILS